MIQEFKIINLAYRAVVNNEGQFINLFEEVRTDKKTIKVYSYSISFESILKIYKITEALEIIKEHKLLNYVIKNKKASRAYKLTDNQIEILKEFLK